MEALPCSKATELELFRLLADLDVPLICPSFPDASTAACEDLVSTTKSRDVRERGGGGCDTDAGQWLADLQEFDAYRTDPYQLFGIPYDATDATIKSTFRRLSLRVHPDRCPGEACDIP